MVFQKLWKIFEGLFNFQAQFIYGFVEFYGYFDGTMLTDLLAGVVYVGHRSGQQ